MGFEVDLGEMLDIAEADGDFGPTWEDYSGKFELEHASAGKTKDGKKQKLSLKWKALDGPYAGEVNWENINVDPNNKVSGKILIKKLVSCGLSKEFIRTSPPLAQVADMIIGIVVQADYSSKPWKSDPTQFSSEFRVQELLDTEDVPAESGELLEVSEPQVAGDDDVEYDEFGLPL